MNWKLRVAHAWYRRLPKMVPVPMHGFKPAIPTHARYSSNEVPMIRALFFASMSYALPQQSRRADDHPRFRPRGPDRSLQAPRQYDRAQERRPCIWFITAARASMQLRRPSSARGSRTASTQWTPPKPIAHDPFRSVGNGVIWEAPDGARLAVLCRPVRRDLVDVAGAGQGLARPRRDLV